MTKPQIETIQSLTTCIAHELASECGERHRPGVDVDTSDYLIKVTSERVKQLRRVREELENIFTASEYLEP